ncbi:DUF4184 family protein [Streptomyces sp. NRRL F-2890]|uniref:DUF4184 family protein n=1 Tax=Streptomyces sp. NRRL F-2890 TaxID=1463845 RepID=UPI001F436FEB|nr:DUF4184 family protein [Streptomyces sp. NRRL F-2890]
MSASRESTALPFTLSHPAAVLPLLRRPFVPAALVMGALAPDVPYYLGELGVAATSSGDWYEPFLNATTTHGPLTGLLVNLPMALLLVFGWRLVRGPLVALLPARVRVGPPAAAPGAGPRVRARYAGWLVLSAVIGIATHLAWDAVTHGDGFLVTRAALLSEAVLGGLTVSRLLQTLSTVLGLALIARHLWRRRDRTRAGHRDAGNGVARLSRPVRLTVLALLALATALGVAAGARADIDAFRYTTVVDHEHPVTRVFEDGTSETTYPATTVRAPWGTFAEGVLTGAAKRGGAAFTAALLLYGAAWHTYRPRAGDGPVSSEQPVPPGPAA